jgi:hypothetical protein
MKTKYIFALLILITSSIFAAKSIDVDLSNQKIYAKENGRIVFSGSIASGKRGRATPTGTFRILEKDRHHVSSKYPEPSGGAKMPYMHRLTNSGVAIHQGYLPGYPASHGCIRVSKATAQKLWRWSRTGIKVRVYGNASNFRYVSKKVKKRRYSKRKSYKRKYAKRRNYKKRKYAKKRTYKKRRARASRHYARGGGYTIVEIYDSW